MPAIISSPPWLNFHAPALAVPWPSLSLVSSLASSLALAADAAAASAAAAASSSSPPTPPTPPPQPPISIPTAILLGLGFSLVQSLGLTIQRKSHLQNQRLPPALRRPDHRRPLWLAGFGVFLVANLAGTLFQIGALPVLILAPLGAVSLLYNALLARFLLDDFLSAYMGVGTLLIVTGAVLIGCFGAVQQPAHDLDQLLSLLARPAFVAFVSVSATFFVGVLAIAHLAEWSLEARLYRGSLPALRRASTAGAGRFGGAGAPYVLPSSGTGGKARRTPRPRRGGGASPPSSSSSSLVRRSWSAPATHLAPLPEVSESSSGVATPALEMADEAARRGLGVGAAPARSDAQRVGGASAAARVRGADKRHSARSGSTGAAVAAAADDAARRRGAGAGGSGSSGGGRGVLRHYGTLSRPTLPPNGRGSPRVVLPPPPPPPASPLPRPQRMASTGGSAAPWLDGRDSGQAGGSWREWAGEEERSAHRRRHDDGEGRGGGADGDEDEEDEERAEVRREAESIARTKLGLAVVFGAASGLLSGACLLLAKAGVELIVVTLGGGGGGAAVGGSGSGGGGGGWGGNNQFARWEAYGIAGTLLGFVVLQLWYLNKGLKLADPTLICPLAFCFYNVGSILLSLVYFDQLGELSATSVAMVFLGTAVLLCGVWIVSLHGRRADDAGEKVGAAATAAQEEEAARLVGSLERGDGADAGRWAGGGEDGERQPLLGALARDGQGEEGGKAPSRRSADGETGPGKTTMDTASTPASWALPSYDGTAATTTSTAAAATDPGAQPEASAYAGAATSSATPEERGADRGVRPGSVELPVSYLAPALPQPLSPPPPPPRLAPAVRRRRATVHARSTSAGNGNDDDDDDDDDDDAAARWRALGGLGLHVPTYLDVRRAMAAASAARTRSARPGRPGDVESGVGGDGRGGGEVVEEEEEARRRGNAGDGPRPAPPPPRDSPPAPERRRRGGAASRLYRSVLLGGGLSVGLAPTSPGFRVRGVLSAEEEEERAAAAEAEAGAHRRRVASLDGGGRARSGGGGAGGGSGGGRSFDGGATMEEGGGSEGMGARSFSRGALGDWLEASVARLQGGGGGAARREARAPPRGGATETTAADEERAAAAELEADRRKRRRKRGDQRRTWSEADAWRVPSDDDDEGDGEETATRVEEARAASEIDEEADEGRVRGPAEARGIGAHGDGHGDDDETRARSATAAATPGGTADADCDGEVDGAGVGADVEVEEEVEEEAPSSSSAWNLDPATQAAANALHHEALSRRLRDAATSSSLSSSSSPLGKWWRGRRG